MLRVSAAAGARLAHFPEGFLSGYALENVAAWEEVDWAAVRHELEEVAELAGELGIWVVLGSAHPLTPTQLATQQPLRDLRWGEGRRPIRQAEVLTHRGSRGSTRLASSRWSSTLTASVSARRSASRSTSPTCSPTTTGLASTVCCCRPTRLIRSSRPRPARTPRSHNYWVSLSVPAQTTLWFHSGLIGPHGDMLTDVGGEPGLAVATLDREDPALRGELVLAKPWRAMARSGDIYEERRVTDERSRVRTEF